MVQQQMCQLRLKQLMRAIHVGVTTDAITLLNEMDRRGDNVDVQFKSSENRTVLMEAIMHLKKFATRSDAFMSDTDDDCRVIQKLLEMRASTLIKDKWGENAFHHALRHANRETIKMMVRLSFGTRKNKLRGCEVGGEFQQRNDGCTPLHVGLKHSGLWKNLKVIMNAQCDTTDAFNIQSRKGQTALHFAVIYENEEAVADILENESTQNNIADVNGCTAFALSVEKPVIRKIFSKFSYKGRRDESEIFKHSFVDEMHAEHVDRDVSKHHNGVQVAKLPEKYKELTEEDEDHKADEVDEVDSDDSGDNKFQFIPSKFAYHHEYRIDEYGDVIDDDSSQSSKSSEYFDAASEMGVSGYTETR